MLLYFVKIVIEWFMNETEIAIEPQKSVPEDKFIQCRCQWKIQQYHTASLQIMLSTLAWKTVLEKPTNAQDGCVSTVSEKLQACHTKSVKDQHSLSSFSRSDRWCGWICFETVHTRGEGIWPAIKSKINTNSNLVNITLLITFAKSRR